MRELLTGTVDPRVLAACRVLVGLGALWITAESYVVLAAVADGALAMPLVGVRAVAPLPQAVLAVGLLGALAMVTGLAARAGAVAVTTTALATLVLDAQAYSNHLVLLMCLAAVLVGARTDGAWTVRRRERRGEVPAWPTFLVLVVVTTVYLWTAVAKLNPEFLSGAVLSTFSAVPPAWAPTAAWAAVAAELALAVVLWVPWARLVGLVLGAGLHWSIVALMADPAPLVAFASLMASGYVVAAYAGRQELAVVRRRLDRPVTVPRVRSVPRAARAARSGQG